MKMGKIILGIVALASGFGLHAADLFWDADGAGSAATGGTGTWTTNNTWRTGSSTGTLGNWTDANNAVFGGTAGVVTIGATAVAPSTSTFSVTDYTLQTDTSTTARTLNGAIFLNVGVNLNLMDSSVTSANRSLNIGGSVSGGSGASLTVLGAQTTGNSSRVNLSAAGSIVSVPITINGTGTGVISLVATATSTSITGNITNNGTARTTIGATSGNGITATGVISGTAGLQFSAGDSGGAGTITLGAQNTYGGATTFNAANGGTIKLAVDNALPTGTNVTMAATNGNGGIFDLNSHNQTIASLASGVGGGSIGNSAAATTGTLSIGGSAVGTFGLVIGGSGGGTGTNAGTVALVRSGTGTTTLSAANLYTGGTTVSGGALVLAGGSALADSGAVNVNGGTLTLNAAETVGAVTLTSGTVSGSALTGSSYAVQNGSVSAVLAGSGITLTKTGAGTVTLSGVNTYTGATSVGAGTLSVNGSTAAGSAVTVTGGTLSGTGTVGGALTLNGGTIAPGNSPGTLRLSGNFTATSGTLSFELASPTSDKLVLSGSGITLTGNTGGAVAINLVDFDGSATTGTYTLISVVGSSISTSNWGLSAFTLVLPSNLSGFLAMSGNDVELTLTGIPEPATYAGVLGALALGGAVWSRRRRALSKK